MCYETGPVTGRTQTVDHGRLVHIVTYARQTSNTSWTINNNDSATVHISNSRVHADAHY